jgi:hypothetical protein
LQRRGELKSYAQKFVEILESEGRQSGTYVVG